MAGTHQAEMRPHKGVPTWDVPKICCRSSIYYQQVDSVDFNVRRRCAVHVQLHAQWSGPVGNDWVSNRDGYLLQPSVVSIQGATPAVYTARLFSAALRTALADVGLRAQAADEALSGPCGTSACGRFLARSAGLRRRVLLKNSTAPEGMTVAEPSRYWPATQASSDRSACCRSAA
jgi:hypothetical protein